MSTPAKSVQFRSVDSVLTMYDSVKVTAFGVKQNGALNFKYVGDDQEEGRRMLAGWLEMLHDSESAAIYTLCLYEDPGERITEKTPVDLSWNFRLRDTPTSFAVGEAYGGGYGAMLNEMRQMRKEIEELKKKPAEDEEGKLGMIGELMQMEPLQPLLMAIGNRIADLVTGPQKVGELKRVSGVPGASAASMTGEQKVSDAIGRLYKIVPDLPDVLQGLAFIAEHKPGQFQFYLRMMRTMYP